MKLCKGKNRLQRVLLFFKSWYFLIPPITLTILSILISQFKLAIIFSSLAIVVLIALFSFGIVYFCTEKFKHQIEDVDVSEQVYSEMRLMLQQYWSGERPGVPGIIKDEDLAKYEAEIECTEIWLVSYDLRTEFNDGLYRDVVINNLKRGIKYIYFVAKTPGIANKIDTEVVNILPDECKPFFDYKLLKDDFFFLVENIDFVIYDPFKASFSGRKAYMSLVLPDSDITYEAPMNNDLLDRIISRLLEYIESK